MVEELKCTVLGERGALLYYGSYGMVPKGTGMEIAVEGKLDYSTVTVSLDDGGLGLHTIGEVTKTSQVLHNGVWLQTSRISCESYEIGQLYSLENLPNQLEIDQELRKMKVLVTDKCPLREL